MTRSRNCCGFPSLSTDRDRDNRSDKQIGRNRHDRTTTTSMVRTAYRTWSLVKRNVTLKWSCVILGRAHSDREGIYCDTECHSVPRRRRGSAPNDARPFREGRDVRSWRAGSVELPRRTAEPDTHGDEGVVGHTHEHEQEANTIAVVSDQLLAVFLPKRSGIPAVAKNDHDMNRPS